MKNKGNASSTVAPALCRNTNGCISGVAAYQMSATGTNGVTNSAAAYTAATWDSPIGLARDGHIIIGPYKSDGNTWGCDDRDVCNGAFVNGSYVYVGSSTFPYNIGCWGPGPDPLYQVGCSSNSCGSRAAETRASREIVFASLLTLAAFSATILF